MTMMAPPLQAGTAQERLNATLARARRSLWGVGIVSAVFNVLLLSGSLYMMAVYDMVLPSRSVSTLMGLLVMVIIAYAFQGVLEFIRGRMLIHMAASVDVDLSADIHMLIGLIARTSPSADSLQPMRDLDQVRNFMAGSGPTALVDLPWMLFFIAFLFLLHPLLGLTVLIGGAVLIFLTMLAERNTKQWNTRLTGLANARAMAAETTRRHADVIQVMGMQSRMRDRWLGASSRFLAVQERLTGISSTLGGVSKIFRMLLQSAVLTVGALLVMEGQATGGVIFASSIISSRALAPVELAIANWRGFVSARQSWGRLKEMFSRIPASDVVDILALPSQTLTVEQVVLGPPGANVPVVKGATFEVRAGQAVAILGPSGSGKSTLVRGITGLWPLMHGSVRLDGADFAQWPAETLGTHIGYLPQNVELIDGTIAQNIARFDPSAGSEAIVAAAQLAGVHELILRLPDGYNSPVGMDGRLLSGGQRQRIALARALYGDPFLIVLDEPNSNLDAEGEEALAKAVRAACERGAIVLLVAHRQSILAAVDYVLLMREGVIIRYGPKAQILPGLVPKIGQVA